MPGVGNFDTLWQQAFPAALTTAAENGAPALGLHPCAKTKLSFARPLAWLVSAFHRALKNGSAVGYVFVSQRQARQRDQRSKIRLQRSAFRELPISDFSPLI